MLLLRFSSIYTVYPVTEQGKIGMQCSRSRCGPGLCRLFLTVKTEHQLTVDTTRGEKLQINVRGTSNSSLVARAAILSP